MRILILDDDEKRHEAIQERNLLDREMAENIFHHYYHVDLVIEFLSTPDAPKIDRMFLDYDLGSGWQTGLDLVGWMVKPENLPVDKRPEMVICHSWSDEYRMKMVRELSAAGFTTRDHPFRK